MKPAVRNLNKAMKNQLLSWKCPLCVPPDNEITRGSQDFLDVATANHIQQHEARAALIAVDSARLSCREANCAIGRSTHINKFLVSSELTLTEYDKTLLAAMKISGDH